jgi:hypothetical protein
MRQGSGPVRYPFNLHSFDFHLVLLLLVTLFNACGDGETEADLAAKEEGAAEDGSGEQLSSAGSEHRFTGYVVNAFEVTVDGVPYRDLETFYTEELARLPAKVQAAGYGPEYRVRFEAEIGFKDLFQNMDVYITSEGDRGYQGQGQVMVDGRFEISFPESIVGDIFKVRANKRISVLLSREGETKKICYNFSAVDRNIEKSETSKPIILSAFESRVTAYACPVPDAGGGIVVPDAGNTQATAAASNGLLRPGMTKQQVLSILGQDNMIIQSTGEWCWQSASDGERNICAVNRYLSCNCSVSFSDAGTLTEQSNISPDLLDILAW